jgi:hypothetical protein
MFVPFEMRDPGPRREPEEPRRITANDPWLRMWEIGCAWLTAVLSGSLYLRCVYPHWSYFFWDPRK